MATPAAETPGRLRKRCWLPSAVMVKAGVVLAVVALTVATGACSSSGQGVKAGASVNYAQQYEADARPVRVATTNFLNYERSLVSAAQAAPFSNALITFAGLLVAQTWPTNTETDIRQLAATSRQEAALLNAGLTSSNGLQVNELEGQATTEKRKRFMAILDCHRRPLRSALRRQRSTGTRAGATLGSVVADP